MDAVEGSFGGMIPEKEDKNKDGTADLQTLRSFDSCRNRRIRHMAASKNSSANDGLPVFGAEPKGARGATMALAIISLLNREVSGA